MKKLISLVFSIMILSTFAVKADTVVGVKIGHGTLDAEDVGTVNNQKGSEDASSPYGAIFVEKALPADNLNLPFNLSAGIEYIPFDALIDIDTNNAGDYEGELSRHTTVYLQGSKEVTEGKILGKIGIVYAKISGVKSSNNTITSSDSDVSGLAVGVAFEKDMNNDYVDFLRVGLDYIDYNTVEAKTSSNTYKADATSTGIYLAVGKKF